MCILQCYQIPLTLTTFENSYRRLSSLKLSNQVLWLNDRTATLMLVVGAMNSIGHLGAIELVDLLQQCVGVITKSTFGSKPLGGNCRERHYHNLWFHVNYRIAKRELRLWQKANPDSLAVKH
jgi:hypothetical protein